MREAQLYCSFKMQNLAKVRRHRSGYTARPDEAVTCRPAASRRPTETPTPYFNPHGYAGSPARRRLSSDL